MSEPAVPAPGLHAPVRVRALRSYLCDTGQGRNHLFVVVETDAGFCGVGEASQSDQDYAVLANMEQLAPMYVGHDLFELIERRTRSTRTGRAGRAMIAAVGGIEIALWDAIGKVLRVPVYQVLGGGCHDRIRCYATISAGVEDWSPDGLGQVAADTVATGYNAVKLPLFADLAGGRAAGPVGPDRIELGIRRLAAVRGQVGDDVDIMVECDFALDRITARAAADAVAVHRCYWLEAPLRWDDPAELAALRRTVAIRIASGELLHGVPAYRELFEARAVDVVQPDVKWTGGILEAKKIAAWAEAYQVALAPHNNSGPVATAASAHLAVTTPNTLLLESSALQPSWVGDLTCGVSVIRHGVVDRAELARRPGLGVPFDESVAQAAAVATYPSK